MVHAGWGGVRGGVHNGMRVPAVLGDKDQGVAPEFWASESSCWNSGSGMG